MNDEQCPECQKVIPVCECGEWECGFYTHLRKECQSRAGKEYREQIERSIKNRDGHKQKRGGA